MPLSQTCNELNLFRRSVCSSPVNNTTLNAGIPGAVYKWQVKSGAAFIDIEDDNFYTGSNTGLLQLNNIPSAWYGYQYRCTVDNNITTPPVCIQFKNTWMGTQDASWENAANWSCASIPDGNTDVVINAGTVILNSNGICRSLLIDPAVSYTVNAGFNLTITK